MIAQFNTTIFAAAQEAIITKWMTYCKNQFIDDIMLWRLAYLNYRFNE